MKINSKFFYDAIEASEFGSLRQLAMAMTNRSGKPMDVATLSLLLRGQREVTLGEIQQLSNLLDIPVLEVLENFGLKVPLPKR